MKTKFFVLLIAVLSFLTAGFSSATKPVLTIPMKDVLIPPSSGGGKDQGGIQRAPGSSDYVTGQIDLDLGLLSLNFINEVDDIVVYVYHSELGLVATFEVDYSTNPSVLIPIPDELGKYTILIYGTDYEGEGEYDN